MDLVVQKNNHIEKYACDKNYWNKPIPKFTPKYADIGLKCQQAIMESMIKKYYKQQMKLGKFIDYELPKYKSTQELYSKLEMEINQDAELLKPWYFITINPKPEIKLSDFVSKIESITEWKIFKKGYYVFEQRGETEDELGKLPHCHILLEKYTIEFARLLTRLETSFKKYCNPPYKNTINVKTKIKEHALETLDEYMAGAKQNDKLDKCFLDRMWRSKNNLKDIYEWDSLATDKENPKKKVQDGRVNNGGKRKNAGRKKNVKTETNEKITYEENTNVILEF